ncbi:hypothetical protein TURU_095335 [Turdus rufiventris]|nr:hypothetical protein TURU_095335 [Turdus rufiventris]
MSQQCALVAKRPMAPGLYQEWCGQQEQGGHSSPLLSTVRVRNQEHDDDDDDDDDDNDDDDDDDDDAVSYS